MFVSDIVIRRCSSTLLRGTIKRFSGLPNVKHGATLHLILFVLHERRKSISRFISTVTQVGHRIGCYHIYRGVDSARIYPVYSSPQHSTSIVYIIRGIRSILTIRGARRFRKLCRILNNVVSPVSNVKPTSLRVSSLIRHITTKKMGRIVLTLDDAVRNSAAGFCVSHGLTSCPIGLSIVTQNVSIKSRLRCASRIALNEDVLGEAPFGRWGWVGVGRMRQVLVAGFLFVLLITLLLMILCRARVLATGSVTTGRAVVFNVLMIVRLAAVLIVPVTLGLFDLGTVHHGLLTRGNSTLLF